MKTLLLKVGGKVKRNKKSFLRRDAYKIFFCLGNWQSLSINYHKLMKEIFKKNVLFLAIYQL